MAEIVISEFMDEAAVADLRASFDVLYDKTLVDRPEELAAAAAGCRALIVRNRTQVRGALLEGAHLRVVGRLGVGLDNIDCKACRERGIAVIPATGANNTAVAEYVLAGLLMLARGCCCGTFASPAGSMAQGTYGGRRDIRQGARSCRIRRDRPGTWRCAPVPVGCGSWPMILFCRRTHRIGEKLGVEPVMLETLLAEADAVSLHVPLTPDTRQLFDAGRLARMKPGAVLINTARGGIVEEAALADALRSGRLAGAMVDVFEKEPLPAGSPLADVPNCLLTPHIAGVTRESNVRVSAVVARKVAECLRGAA